MIVIVVLTVIPQPNSDLGDRWTGPIVLKASFLSRHVNVMPSALDVYERA